MRFLSILFAFSVLIISKLSGQPWQLAAGIPEANFFSLDKIDGRYYAGTWEELYTSDNISASWSPTGKIGDYGGVNTLIKFQGKLMVGTQTGGVFLSADNGQTWQPKNNGLTILSVYKLATYNGKIYCGTQGDGVFEFNPVQETWSSFNAGLFLNVAGHVNALLQADSVFLAGAGANGFCFRRTLSSSQWQESPLKAGLILPGYQVTDLYNDSLRVWAAGNTVYFSEDLGLSWTEDANGILNGYFASFAAGAGRNFYVNNRFTGAYIYERLQGSPVGNPWTLFEFFPNKEISAIKAAGDTLIIAMGDGVWYKKLQTVSTPAPVIADLISIYPNPSISEITLASRIKTRAEIIDLLGRTHRTIYLNDEQTILDVSSLPSGVYWVRPLDVKNGKPLKFILQAGSRRP